MMKCLINIGFDGGGSLSNIAESGDTEVPVWSIHLDDGDNQSVSSIGSNFSEESYDDASERASCSARRHPLRESCPQQPTTLLITVSSHRRCLSEAANPGHHRRHRSHGCFEKVAATQNHFRRHTTDHQRRQSQDFAAMTFVKPPEHRRQQSQGTVMSSRWDSTVSLTSKNTDFCSQMAVRKPHRRSSPERKKSSSMCNSCFISKNTDNFCSHMAVRKPQRKSSMATGTEDSCFTSKRSTDFGCSHMTVQKPQRKSSIATGSTATTAATTTTSTLNDLPQPQAIMPLSNRSRRREPINPFASLADDVEAYLQQECVAPRNRTRSPAVGSALAA